MDYISGLDWQAITREKQPIAEVGAEKELARVQMNLAEIAIKLKRLTKMATSSDNPPETIVSEMKKLETEAHVEREKELRLSRELESLIIRRASLTEAAIEFKDLIAKGDMQSRLRLREEIRRRVNRIDVYPNGATKEYLQGEPVSAPGWPAFKITFSNGAVRWVFCESRKPKADGAVVLDTGVPATGMELELRERPEVVYGSEKQSEPRRKTLVPVYVPKPTRRVPTIRSQTASKK